MQRGAPRDHWPVHALQWSRIGGPLRPCAEDVRAAEEAAMSMGVRAARLRALLLGVTPELARLPWPEGTELVAVDRSQAMIEAVWPKSGLPAGAEARCGDWRALPLGDGCIDFALGDGCFSVFAFPGEYRSFGAELARVLAPGARIHMRFYVAPDASETPEAVAESLWAGEIGNFHAFKWRLAMAVQAREAGAATPAGARLDAFNVRLGDIWEAFRQLCPDTRALAARLGWDADVIATIDAYRDSQVSYSFPTLTALRSVLSEAFVEHACFVPRYELGERCPALLLSAR